MLGLDILDVAIGVVFTFCLLSLVATSLRELVETWLQMRAATLEQGIRELLNDPTGANAKKLYDHPLIASLFKGAYDPEKLVKPFFSGVAKGSTRYALKSNLPAYIPARNFALAMMDFAGAGGKESVSSSGEPLTLERLRAGIAEIPEPRIRQAMQVAVDQAHNDLEQVRVNVEKWFDSSMDRVSGWYRKHTQWLIFLIGLSLAIGLNVDTFRLASALQTNTALRSVVVAEAEAVSASARASNATDEAGYTAAVEKRCENIKPPLADGETCAQRRLQTMGLPVGWGVAMPGDARGWLATVLGWLITAIAISIGAPFWFDTLNRLMVIRSTVKPHEKSPEEASEDRQSPRSPAPPPPPPPPAALAAPAPAAADPDFVKHQWTGASDPQEGEL